MLTHVGARSGVVGVQVATRLASLDRRGDDRAAFWIFLEILSVKNHPIDLIAVALVVDQAVGAELRDGQKAGALQELGASLLAARHERRQREAGERIPWQEAFSGKVAVRVEVRVEPVAQIASQ